jgi:hypothetical protein
MSGEKKRHRRRHSPILIEENITIDSKLTTTTSITTEENKHTENTIRKWYHTDEVDDNTQDEIQSKILLPNEKISKKIERVLRKINAWTNERSSTPTNNNNDMEQTSVHDTSFNKTNLPIYDNIHQDQRYESRFIKPNSFQQRCRSSTRSDPNVIKCSRISTHQPYSTMTFPDRPLPRMTTTSCAINNDKRNYFSEGQNRKVRGKVQIHLFNEHD